MSQFPHPTWLYAPGEARLFEAGEDVPASGWFDHPSLATEAVHDAENAADVDDSGHATKSEIIAELKALGVQFDARTKRDALADLLARSRP